MSSIKIKDCPFCGQYSEFRGDVTKGLYLCYVECLSCGASTKYTLDSASSIDAWNKRVIDK